RDKLVTGVQTCALPIFRPAIQPYRSSSDTRAAWAKEYLRQEFRNEFGGDHPPDWQVHTGFRPSVQEEAERAVAAGLRRLNQAGRSEERRVGKECGARWG